ncbi:hypothetical protein M413DRAFT_448946 [Hebeloma cylindrosporum]|uniref:F-box domain-containing protein n=1 Tax=Hebeloma cylindrosporum TaxID=76867 RepID=A0A0C2Y704_HEBCY|nr:hypothetical protein M413DRAFT_448946 [Hebeloma cylindrosporum h7]
MSHSSAASFRELPPELFPVIVEHLPFVYRPPILRSLALTCHRIHDIVFPELVYDTVRLVGEDQASTTLNTLIASAELVTAQDIQDKGNPSLSHCIRHLCLESSIKTPMRGLTSLDALQKLIDVDGLQHLSSLTLQVHSEWDGTYEEDESGPRLRLPSSFLTSLDGKCPNLKRVQLSDFPQQFGKEWIEPHIFSIKRLTSIRIEGNLLNYPSPTINLSQLPPNLHTLDLHVVDRGENINSNVLHGCVIPNLCTLILNDFFASDALAMNSFWRAHPGIERLELGRKVDGNWFDNFEAGMLPNLKYLQCSADHALVLLPRVSNSLIKLSLWETYNAQGPYLLRVVSPGGVLPALRSLGIHRVSRNSPEPREGHRWRENENGDVLEVKPSKATRQFDGNYIMSLSKAAPNLEELELMGSSDDTLDSLTNSLSRFSKLQRLTLSGAINMYSKPFFARSANWEDYAEYNLGVVDKKNYGKYAPEIFDEAARDLANGCRTLDAVTMGTLFGWLSLRDGLSRKIVRECDGGMVKEVTKTRALGNIIGREDEW